MVFKLVFYPHDAQKNLGPSAYIAVENEIVDRQAVKVLTEESTNAIGLVAAADRLIKELENLKLAAETKFKDLPAGPEAKTEEPPPKPFDVATQST